MACYVAPVTPGDDVRVVFTKWGGGPHWEMDAVVLGTDDCGTWLGGRPGRSMAKPGRAVTIPYATVMVAHDRAGFVASFNARGDGPEASRCSTYVDIVTAPVWRDATVTMVDLDLDVVRRWNGEVEVDDEDEFAEHQVSLGYPAEVVAHAVHWCAAVRRAVEGQAPPFDGRADDWLRRLSGAG